MLPYLCKHRVSGRPVLHGKVQRTSSSDLTTYMQIFTLPTSRMAASFVWTWLPSLTKQPSSSVVSRPSQEISMTVLQHRLPRVPRSAPIPVHPWSGLLLSHGTSQKRRASIGITPSIVYIQQLDASTGASLKLTVVDASARIWTMVAGGGASVVYADAIVATGYAHELTNYGEYSAPSEGQTYEYAKTISESVVVPYNISTQNLRSFPTSRPDHTPSSPHRWQDPYHWRWYRQLQKRKMLPLHSRAPSGRWRVLRYYS